MNRTNRGLMLAAAGCAGALLLSGTASAAPAPTTHAPTAHSAVVKHPKKHNKKHKKRHKNMKQMPNGQASGGGTAPGGGVGPGNGTPGTPPPSS